MTSVIGIPPPPTADYLLTGADCSTQMGSDRRCLAIVQAWILSTPSTPWLCTGNGQHAEHGVFAAPLHPPTSFSVLLYKSGDGVYHPATGHPRPWPGRRPGRTQTAPPSPQHRGVQLTSELTNPLNGCEGMSTGSK